MFSSDALIMSYCINPDCVDRQNPDGLQVCQACGTSLQIQGRYQLIRPLRPLDKAYPSEVFEVCDRGQIKVLKSLHVTAPKLVDLFIQEASILTNLSHPGIPKTDPDSYFTLSLSHGKKLYCLIMEYIKGQNLEQWMQENEFQSMSQDFALQWLKQLALTLDYIHQHNLFHRDIKPSNIIYQPNGNLVLIDFGTARKVTATVVDRGGVTIVYSDGYTAPEQLQGRSGPQSDFFALGRTFVYLLTGKPPESLSADLKTGQLHWRSAAPHISNSFADLIDRLIHPSPEKRLCTTQDLLRGIEFILLKSIRHQRKTIVPFSLAKIAALPNFRLWALSGLVVGGGLWWQRQPIRFNPSPALLSLTNPAAQTSEALVHIRWFFGQATEDGEIYLNICDRPESNVNPEGGCAKANRVNSKVTKAGATGMITKNLEANQPYRVCLVADGLPGKKGRWLNCRVVTAINGARFDFHSQDLKFARVRP